MRWIVRRLAEASTWKGMLAIATATGVQIAPELQDAILGTGLALIGLIQVLIDRNEVQK